MINPCCNSTKQARFATWTPKPKVDAGPSATPVVGVNAMRITNLVAPPELVAAWERDVEELTAVQEAAVQAGILSGTGNILVVAPTSSGKTLVGEMAAAQ